MEQYKIYCTKGQTQKALELGAPLKQVFYGVQYDETLEEYHLIKIGCKLYEIPTAEEMIGWLEEQGILIDIDTEWINSALVYVWDCENKLLINNLFHGSRKETMLAAIDEALEYIELKNQS